MNGFISYPRTDNTVYPSSIDLKEVLNNLKENIYFKKWLILLLQKELKPTKGNRKTTDHPPFTLSLQEGRLSDDEWKL